MLRLPASSRFESKLGSSEGVGCRRTLAVAVDRIVAVEGLFAAVAGAFFVAAVKMLEAAASSFASSSLVVESWFSLAVGTWAHICSLDWRSLQGKYPYWALRDPSTRWNLKLRTNRIPFAEFAAKTFLLFAQSVEGANQVVKLASCSIVTKATPSVCLTWAGVRFRVSACSSTVGLAALLESP